MKIEEYHKLVKKNMPKVNKIKNLLVAFFSGGILAAFLESCVIILNRAYFIDKNICYQIITILLIFLTSLFTALGFFDDVVKKLKCGLIIPTTGFSHSVSSAALEFKKEGMVTGMGSSFLKLAGSVILYGITSAFLFALIKVIILWLI